MRKRRWMAVALAAAIAGLNLGLLPVGGRSEARPWRTGAEDGTDSGTSGNSAKEDLKRAGREIKQGVKELPGKIKKGWQDAREDLKDPKGRGKKKAPEPESSRPS